MMESTTVSPCSFQLWHDPWIRVIGPDGRIVTRSIGACLTDAHILSALHDPSPLVVGGIHRLLTAILQAIYAPESLDAIVDVLESGQFDSARLEAFAAQYADRFDLFHPTAPFLQTGDVPLDGGRTLGKGADHAQSVAYLFSEIPTGINRTLFQHTTDGRHVVCPACCARGLITIPAFVLGSGKGNRTSINGVPPIYVLPAGENLFQSLALSLTTPDFQPRAAAPERHTMTAWTRDTAIPKNGALHAVGYLESLTFPARRIRLFPEAVLQEPCTVCGDMTLLAVRHMVFTIGHWRDNETVLWDDPFVAFRPPKGKRRTDKPRPVCLQEGKALWREYSTLLSTVGHEDVCPKIVRQVGKLVDRCAGLHDRQTIQFRCIGLRTEQASISEWLDAALEVPPRLLVDPVSLILVEDALVRANLVEQEMTWVFNWHFRPTREMHKGSNIERLTKKEQKLVRFKTLYRRMQALFWERLAPEFRTFIVAAADPAQHLTLERTWVTTLVQVGEQTFTEITSQVGDRATALRVRVEAQAECHRRLSTKRKEWLGEQ